MRDFDTNHTNLIIDNVFYLTDVNLICLCDSKIFVQIRLLKQTFLCYGWFHIASAKFLSQAKEGLIQRVKYTP